MIDLLIEVLNVSGIKFGDTWLLSPTTNLWGSSMPILRPHAITTDYHMVLWYYYGHMVLLLLITATFSLVYKQLQRYNKSTIIKS